MAGCPTFAWGEPYLKKFMESYTNPLKTPCCFYPGGWDPDIDVVWKAMCRWRETLEPEGLWKTGARSLIRSSMCMIARDSARTIEAALKSIRPWVDEMVVVDTGSTDDTPLIAKSCGAQVFHSPWRDSFAAARNESIRHARGDWILWMDSDDTIDEENGRKLREHIGRRHPPSTMGYVVQVRCPSEPKAGAYSTATVVDHVKLFRRLPAIAFTGRIHEQVLPSIRRLGGDVEWADIYITHSGSDHTPEGRLRKQSRDLRLLELELAEDPDNTFTLFNIGMTLIDMSRPADAVNSLCRSLQMADKGDSHTRKIYALLVQAYAELKRPESALKTCVQGLSACPMDPELLFRKGVLEQTVGQLDQAERSFKAVVEGTPDRHFSSFDHGILGIKAWHNLAVLYEQQRRHDLAAAGWQRVLEFDRSNRVAWRGLLDALTALNDVGGLEKIAAVGKEDGVPSEVQCIVEARLLVQRGCPRAAVEKLRVALEANDSVDLLAELSQIAFGTGLLDAAEWGLSELAKRCPDDPSVFQNLGMIYLRRHNYSKAAQSARRSLALRPNYPAAQQVLDLATKSAVSADRVT